MPTSKSDKINYGVRGDFKSKKDDERKKIINKNTDIVKNDDRVLRKIKEKIESNINSLSDLNQELENYSKVNNEALSAIISKLKRFKEAVNGEIDTDSQHSSPDNKNI